MELAPRVGYFLVRGLLVSANLSFRHDASDVSVIPELQRGFAKRLCAAGQIVDYRGYAGRDHMGVIAADSPVIPDALQWTYARFAGKPPGGTCSFAER